LLPLVLTTTLENEEGIRVSAEIILHNAKIATNGVPSFVEAIAISDGKVTAPVKMTKFYVYACRRRASSTAGGALSYLDSMIRTCIRSAAGSTTTLSCAGMVYLHSPTPCAC